MAQIARAPRKLQQTAEQQEKKLADSGAMESTGAKTGYVIINGHISQIPGLSPTISTLPEEKMKGRRVRVLDSDSDYVKLAKTGGHKGLLWHEGAVVSKPNPYKPPNWFGAESGEISDPSTPITSKEKKNPGAFQPREPPFGSDNMSAWERDNSSADGKEKFRVFDKKPAPVDMSKLLSFGYADGNKPLQ
ncbi:uncharacterized protein C7orf57 homolog [Pholidichthys leucotaenia]